MCLVWAEDFINVILTMGQCVKGHKPKILHSPFLSAWLGIWQFLQENPSKDSLQQKWAKNGWENNPIVS